MDKLSKEAIEIITKNRIIELIRIIGLDDHSLLPRIEELIFIYKEITSEWDGK